MEHATPWTSLGAQIVPPPRVGLRRHELDGEVVLFNPATGGTHHLNASAVTVWTRCDGRATTHELARRQTEDYDVDFETALDDVEQLLALFGEAGLIQQETHA
jgi:PqqD family protein of HPr-rel-A system